jgi:hypothetical protein
MVEFPPRPINCDPHRRVVEFGDDFTPLNPVPGLVPAPGDDTTALE